MARTAATPDGTPMVPANIAANAIARLTRLRIPIAGHTERGGPGRRVIRPTVSNAAPATKARSAANHGAGASASP